MKIALVNYQTVYTVLFRVTTLIGNEVQTEAAKILLHISSKKTVNETDSRLSQNIVNETESRLLFLDKIIHCRSQS